MASESEKLRCSLDLLANTMIINSNKNQQTKYGKYKKILRLN